MKRVTKGLEIHPAGPPRWADVETLFGARGACSGCWCQTWRKSKKDFDRDRGEGNRKALQSLVENGREPGLLAYVDGVPVGWVAVAPREDYPRLGASRILAPVDEQPVWSVSCIFILKGWRRKGISVELLKAAAKHAFDKGAEVVEGYPSDLKEGILPDAFVWTGLFPAFRKAGYREVARRSAKRPIVRRFPRAAHHA